MEQQIDLAQQVYQLVVNFMVTYSFQLLGAVLVLLAGFVVGGWVSRLLLRVQERRDVDVTLRQFIASTVRLLVVGMFLIVALSQLGVSIEEISLATTVLRTEDGERIVIPNRQIAGEVHTNSFAHRVVEGQVGIAYGADPQVAIRTIRDALGSIDGVTGEPAPQIGIDGFGDSAVNLDYRFWVPTERYFEVKRQANLAVFLALAERGISIPFPQREVRLEQI